MSNSLMELERPDEAEVRILARPQADAIAPPTVEQILMLAVEKGTDAASMERLVALMERVQAKRAEQAFNAAKAAFQAECPPIHKAREAKNDRHEVMYKFADLPGIKAIVDPVLQKHGFSYKWDQNVGEKLTEIVCTLRHIEGHSESSRFSCVASGTRIMSAAQVSASATTFGMRYSLCSVLGIVPDNDMDGAGDPRAKADADPAAPKVATRGERASGPVTKAELSELCKAWLILNPGCHFNDFVKGSQDLLETGDDLSVVANWSRKQYEYCRKELEAASGN